MPLYDHFRPPWSASRPWEGFHGAWAAAMAFHLNAGVLPGDYFAMPLLEVGGRVEVDAAAFRDASAGAGSGVWRPPPPALVAPLEGAGEESYEVRVTRNFGGPQLRAAIELVSPSNKDRPAARSAFASKCANHLRRGVAVVVIDIVTERSGNLHADILAALGPTEGAAWEATSRLYAASYRGVVAEPSRLEAWTYELVVGGELPEVPLWLEPDLCVPLRLGESYALTCGGLRMGG